MAMSKVPIIDGAELKEYVQAFFSGLDLAKVDSQNQKRLLELKIVIQELESWEELTTSYFELLIAAREEVLKHSGKRIEDFRIAPSLVGLKQSGEYETYLAGGGTAYKRPKDGSA